MIRKGPPRSCCGSFERGLGDFEDRGGSGLTAEALEPVRSTVFNIPAARDDSFAFLGALAPRRELLGRRRCGRNGPGAKRKIPAGGRQGEDDHEDADPPHPGAPLGDHAHVLTLYTLDRFVVGRSPSRTASLAAGGVPRTRTSRTGCSDWRGRYPRSGNRWSRRWPRLRWRTRRRNRTGCRRTERC